jgi:hypothetical protein
VQTSFITISIHLPKSNTSSQDDTDPFITLGNTDLMYQSKARRCLLEMLIEFQAVEEEALKAVGTIVKFDLGESRCGFLKLGRMTGLASQLKEATLENWELALTLLS